MNAATTLPKPPPQPLNREEAEVKPKAQDTPEAVVEQVQEADPAKTGAVPAAESQEMATPSPKVLGPQLPTPHSR
eukprot:3971283-Amphidinium_carterae.2